MTSRPAEKRLGSHKREALAAELDAWSAFDKRARAVRSATAEPSQRVASEALARVEAVEQRRNLQAELAGRADEQDNFPLCPVGAEGSVAEQQQRLEKLKDIALRAGLLAVDAASSVQSPPLAGVPRPPAAAELLAQKFQKEWREAGGSRFINNGDRLRLAVGDDEL
jgi:hypothetical protein